MRRYDDPSNDPEALSSRQSCPDCIIATRGYDFREGHLSSFLLSPVPPRARLQRYNITLSTVVGVN
jgi:hypothetical protein